MFIAMNRFKVLKGSEQDFENVWLGRETHLGEMPGFIVFHLLKGPEREDHVLYSSHTMWRSHADFEAWTKSEQFRKAHARAGGNKPRSQIFLLRFTLSDHWSPLFERRSFLY